MDYFQTMYHYSSANNKTFVKTTSPLLMESVNIYSRETAFDPLNYEFDAETMTEPFTYFHDGPAEPRRKPIIFSSILPSCSSSTSLSNPLWSPTSSISSLDENYQNHHYPLNNVVHSKYHHHHHHRQQQQEQLQQQELHHSSPKTICRHCKSHNMPECLYTSHSMYDETGEIFCPVLKKCHCANCIRVINSSERQDDDSDDDHNLRYTSTDNESSHLYGIYPRQNLIF